MKDDPRAHGHHLPVRGRVHCGSRAYKDGFAPCQLSTGEVRHWATDPAIDPDHYPEEADR